MLGSLTNWEGDLFEQFNRLQREMDDFWGTPSGPASIRAVARGTYPAINVGATADTVEVYVFAAGLDREKLDLSIQQNLLTVSGTCDSNAPGNSRAHMRERFTGQFARSVGLPEDVDPNSAQARYYNGVLQISLQRKAEGRPRKIELNREMEV